MSEHSIGTMRGRPSAGMAAMRGITLFEMLVVMGIVGILMAIALPSYHYFTTSNRIAAEVNGLLGDLQYARSEAIKEGQSVEVCVVASATPVATATCPTVGSNTWNSGWVIISPAYPTVPLRQQITFASTDTLTANNNVAAITFNREGFAVGVPAGEMITLHSTPTSNNATRCLSITLVGLMTIQTYNGTTCT